MKDRAVVSLSGAQRALFVSDMHLGEHDPVSAQWFLQALDDALEGRLEDPAPRLPSAGHTPGPAYSHVFLLGDLFELWVGDDDQSQPYALALLERLTMAEQAGSHVFIMRGNRDFLLGKAPEGEPTWLQDRQACLLPDPCLIEAFGTRIILTHGDLLCTDDLDYQNYRKTVRSEAWQSEYLAKPLTERQNIAQTIRNESMRRKTVADTVPPSDNGDAKEDAVMAMFSALEAAMMIHGHTHRPALHQHRQGEQTLSRHVLPDWSAPEQHEDSKPQRGYFLVVDARGIHQLHPKLHPNLHPKRATQTHPNASAELIRTPIRPF